MASVAARPSLPPPAPSLAARLTPVEGWSIVLLHAVLTLLAGWAVERAEWAPWLDTVAWVAPLGALFGLILAKCRVPDLLAHLMATGWGIALAVWITGGRATELGPDREARLRFLWDRARRWYGGTIEGQEIDDIYLFVIVMVVTIWLVAYSSAWMLYRRRWLPIALLLPGMLILLNLAYAPRVGSVPLVLYAGAACVLAARHHAFRREQEWRRVDVPVPPRLPWHFLTAGVNVALLVVIVGWAAPLSLRSNIAQNTWQRLEEPRQAVERRMDRWFSAFGGPGRASGSYAGFGDSFQLGGPLSLGDDPAMLLRGRDATYLAGQRYDRYDGRGWSTGVNRTFRDTGANGKRFSPQVTFQAEQAIQLSPDITGAREPVQSAITLLRPKRDLLFTSDTYLASDRATSVQLSWRQLVDEPIEIGSGADDGVPPDLLYLMSLLRRATFTDDTDGVTTADEPKLAAQIADEREALADRFLTVEWEVGRNGKVETLFVSGQVPVYDDVEAVFDQGEPVAGTSYILTSAVSGAAPDELRAAGTAYPEYVEARYQELPSSVTPRTQRLAQNIAAASDNPFDIAAAIEEHLRGRIVYNENIPFPPDDQDVVDYVLFDSKQGYCEYYASAMAVMLRSLEIPARIVAGYYPGDFDPESGGYLYRELNAHAWVEVFFPGYGWIPFEPTAARSELAYGDDIPDDTDPATPPVDPIETPGPEPTADASPAVPPTDGQTPNDAQPSLLERASRQPGWKPGLAASGLLLLALVGALIWLWGFRGLSPAGSLYARALRLGGWRGVRPHPAMTPHEYADELGRAVPAAQAPARTVADLYVVEQYAGQPPERGAARAASHAWRSLRRALLRPRFGRRRSAARHRGGSYGD